MVQPESRAAYARLVRQGWTDAIRKLHGEERVYTFWHYMRNRWRRNAGLRGDCAMQEWTDPRGEGRVIMLPYGSC